MFWASMWRLELKTAIDSTAFHDLIAQVRSTAAELAEGEKKVAAFKAELSQQEYRVRLDASSALLKSIEPLSKRANSGWVPATDNGYTRTRKRQVSAAPKSRGKSRMSGAPD